MRQRLFLLLVACALLPIGAHRAVTEASDTSHTLQSAVLSPTSVSGPQDQVARPGSAPASSAAPVSCLGGAIYRYSYGTGVWGTVAGAAHDIAGNGNSDVVWIIGTNQVGDYCGIWQYVGGPSEFNQVPGAGTDLAVDNTGQPWVLQAVAGGGIYRRVAGNWQLVPGLAAKISAGADGAVVALGFDPVPGGHLIYTYVGAPNYWQPIAGAAEHIAVAADDTIWAVQSNGDIYHYVSGVWNYVPGKARAITAGPDGVYALSATGVTPYEIYRYVGGSQVWQVFPFTSGPTAGLASARVQLWVRK